ncbi:hypothetical protein P7L78_20190 [Tistrella bauzanensis]|uniref:Uncharacterized protein n=2 Tax=Tistrella TaxID=171436 RepID=A0ABU9YPG4_9PROT|nr:hypothetical protein [Tistrella bauzanensis]GGB50019.1 hypothetical protein GCM10011505_33890 [Tistrella bauzanensis]
MLSLSKLLLLVLVVLAVIVGARVSRIFSERRAGIAGEGGRARDDRAAPRHTSRRRREAPAVAEADRCARCGSFVVPGAAPCGRSGCPVAG